MSKSTDQQFREADIAIERRCHVHERNRPHDEAMGDVTAQYILERMLLELCE
jgi:hypothetical protein